MKQGYDVVVAGAGNAAFCAGLAAQMGVAPDALEGTVAEFNVAVCPGVCMPPAGFSTTTTPGVAGLPPGRYSGVAPATGRPAHLGQAKPEG